MAKKPTTSGFIKEFFAKNGLGDEKDWKRTAKNKNEAGQWVRVYENEETGKRIEMTELGDGKFLARALTETANAAFSPPSGDEGLTPSIENDPAKIAPAKKIVENIYDEDLYENDSLIKKAGKALANRFIFAVYEAEGMETDNQLNVQFCPDTEDAFDEHLDHLIGHLLPPLKGEWAGASREDMEATFNFNDYKDPLALAKDLQARGFVWDEDFQLGIDNDMAQDMASRLQALKRGSNNGKPPRCPIKHKP